MLIDALAEVLESSGCVKEFWAKLDGGADATLGVVSSARPFLVASYFTHHRCPTLVIVPGEDAADTFARTVAAYIGEELVLRFPERTDASHLGQRSNPRTIAHRLECAYRLFTGKEAVIIASARSLIRTLPPPSSHAVWPMTLYQGSELAEMGLEGVEDLDDLKRKLEAFGYSNTGELDGVGTFAVHGGTIDIYPGNLPYPIRLDLFGDEVEEIRRIVPSTGQMISELDHVDIFPVTELPITERSLCRARRSIEKAALTNKALRDILEKLDGGLRFDGFDVLLPYIYDETATLGDYAGGEALTVLVEPRAIFDDMGHGFEEVVASFKGTLLNPEGLYSDPLHTSLGSSVRATYVSIMQSGIEVDDELPIKRTNVAGSHDKLFGKMRNWIDAGYTCIFSIPSYRARKDHELELVDHGLAFEERLDGLDDTTAALEPGIVTVVDVDIPLGIVIPKARLAMVSIEDTKGARAASRGRSRIDITDITFPYAPGDYVVHETYGIALFKAIVLREFEGAERDYLELDYAEGDKLFLPVEQFDKITRYVGPEDHSPKITRLNTADWSKAIIKARKATKKLAFDLIEVYARRAATKGHRFRVDTPWLREMEESFPYTETPDQAAAIADIKADMKSAHPMDRLICGDVGFGKTEVALRAAFIAAQDGKQVMVLCPTTILAQQHYTSFKERFDPFGMTVEVLSRFRSAKQQKEALEGFEKGNVQVLIGTHRLLSRDVNPHDLGLVIIDEEQRFGVQHKEQFKNLRESIDVLTLSATPIPRTMQMAVSGVRDMSLIMTPPGDRLPVKVHVGEWDPDVVADAIRYELARGGQVYYVSNRVKTIDDAIEKVEEAAPEARVGVAHGQMSRDELEHVMEDFAAGELDVLVATTIIESGIDNPHTNTLIIEDSQRLGLAQMYQLKGRVGRSHVQAFAYFMFPEEVPLTEEAQARLAALTEHQDLGSGMRIAMKDLEIRGAGNLLGAEQSGNMSAVGFDLFAQMLNEAVLDARDGLQVGEGQRASIEANINIPGHMYLPSDYITNVQERVLWYRRLANTVTQDDIDALERDMEASYGEMPTAARSFFEKERLRIFAMDHKLSNVAMTGGNLVIEGLSLSREQLIPLKRLGGRYLKDRSKLILPAKNLARVTQEDDHDAVVQVMALLRELFPRSSQDAGEDGHGEGGSAS